MISRATGRSTGRRSSPRGRSTSSSAAASSTASCGGGGSRKVDVPLRPSRRAPRAGRGWHFIGPDMGARAEGPSERPGRMSEPEAIFAAAERLLGGAHNSTSKWSGKRVVVTAGATREHLDPVRVITNPSSGRMGYALAEAARERGAEVVLITGPTELTPPAGLATTHVETTEEMQRALQGLVKQADVLIMAAAP